MLGIQDPFLAKVLPRLVALMGEDYPELKASENRIAEILTLEEDSFLRTLKRGGNILNAVISDAKGRPHKEITGEEAFKLKDTYGLPLEEIMLIAKDSHLNVNLDAYQLLEEQAREKSKAAHVKAAQSVEDSVYKDFAAKHPCKFVGFTDEKIDASRKKYHSAGHLARGSGCPLLVFLHRSVFSAAEGSRERQREPDAREREPSPKRAHFGSRERVKNPRGEQLGAMVRLRALWKCHC